MTTRSGDEKEEMKRNVKESKTTRSKREEQHSIYSARIQEKQMVKLRGNRHRRECNKNPGINGGGSRIV